MKNIHDTLRKIVEYVGVSDGFVTSPNLHYLLEELIIKNQNLSADEIVEWGNKYNWEERMGK